MTKDNKIKLLKLELVLTLPYQVKSIYYTNNDQFYRYKIQEKRKYWVDE
jgi:hypothetical protein